MRNVMKVKIKGTAVTVKLSHALLKQKQNIRGTAEEHEAAAKDAVGDIVVFLAELCNARGWDLELIASETWSQVRRRDWRKEGGTDG